MKYFYFYDCPRTGGTSFKRWANQSDIVERLHFGDGKGWHHVPFKPREVVSALAPPAQRDKVFTFTLLRDPIEHTASLYAKIRRHKHSYRSKLANLNFDQWIHKHFEEDRSKSPPPWGFSMVRFFDPETEDVGRAIANIETMDFVGFTERLTPDLKLMFQKANTRANFDGRRLNPGIREFKITTANRVAIKKIRFDDYQLVNYFREKRDLEPYG
jgi:hypothetical protein